jgi:hypothetical protein
MSVNKCRCPRNLADRIAAPLRAHLCKLSTACGASEICVRSLRGQSPPPTASPSDAAHRNGSARCPFQTFPSQASRGLDRAPLSLPPLLELAPRAGRFREAASVSGRSGSACPENGTVCRIGFAALRLSGKPWPILAMAPRVTGSMIASLLAWLHVCPFAWWPARPDGPQAACLLACLPVCMSGSPPALVRRRIGRARPWPATTFPSRRSNAAPGGPPRRRQPIGRPRSSSATGKGACTTTPQSAESRLASFSPPMMRHPGRRTGPRSGMLPRRARPGPIR